MIHTEFLDWGLQMTVLGMFLVFGLLALLWVLLTLILKLDKEEEEEAPAETAPAAPESTPEPVAAAPASGVPEINGLPADLVAAILVAAHKHRQTLWRQAAPLARAVPPGSLASRWLAAGRARQTHDWQPRGR